MGGIGSRSISTCQARCLTIHSSGRSFGTPLNSGVRHRKHSPWRHPMNCPHCRTEKISAWRRVLGTCQYPINCPNCGRKSVPGSLPESEYLRIAIASPLVILALLGPRFLKFGLWVSATLVLLAATAFTMIYLQLRLQLRWATSEDLSGGRSKNQVAGVAIMFVVAVIWFW